MPGFGFSCVNLRIYGLSFNGIRGCSGMFSQGDASRLSCFVMQGLLLRLAALAARCLSFIDLRCATSSASFVAAKLGSMR
jgi:hypothetical protein